MFDRMLYAHYSVLALLSRVGFCGGLGLMFWFFAAQMGSQNWFTVISSIMAAVMAAAALTFSYLLLTARGQVVVSIDASGFKDRRLTSTAIPWNMIQSVSPYIPYKSRNATGLEVAINPAFRNRLSIRPVANLLAWATGYGFSGSVVRLDTSILDADCNEISRFANSFIPDGSKATSPNPDATLG